MNGNGEINGFHNSLIEEDCFLFTSESVGEGHPGKLCKLNLGDLTVTYSTPHVHCNNIRF